MTPDLSGIAGPERAMESQPDFIDHEIKQIQAGDVVIEREMAGPELPGSGLPPAAGGCKTPAVGSAIGCKVAHRPGLEFTFVKLISAVHPLRGRGTTMST
jgi:hypothetical protein